MRLVARITLVALISACALIGAIIASLSWCQAPASPGSAASGPPDWHIAVPAQAVLFDAQSTQAARDSYGAETWHSSASYGDTAQFYKSRYQVPGLLVHTVGQPGEQVTTLDWQDQQGFCTVLIEPASVALREHWLFGHAVWPPAMGAKAAAYLATAAPGTVIQIARSHISAELALDPLRSGLSRYMPPRRLGIVIYPGAKLNYSGFAPGRRVKTGVAEFEVMASVHDVEQFYDAQRPLWESAITSTRGTASWLSGTMSGSVFEATNAAGDYTMDIRRANDELPTIVRVCHTGPTIGEFILRHSAVPWL